jgi:hypothetical protein
MYSETRGMLSGVEAPRAPALLALPSTRALLALPNTRKANLRLLHLPCVDTGSESGTLVAVASPMMSAGPCYVRISMDEVGCLSLESRTSKGKPVACPAGLNRKLARVSDVTLAQTAHLVARSRDLERLCVPEASVVDEAQFYHFNGSDVMMHAVDHAPCGDAHYVTYDPRAHALSSEPAGEVLCAVDTEKMRDWRMRGGDADWTALRVAPAGIRACNELLCALGRVERVGNWVRQNPEQHSHIFNLDQLSAEIHALLPAVMLGSAFTGADSHIQRRGMNATGDKPRTGVDFCVVSNTVLFNSSGNGEVLLMKPTALEAFVANPRCVGNGVRTELITKANGPQIVASVHIAPTASLRDFLPGGAAVKVTSGCTVGKIQRKQAAPIPGALSSTVPLYAHGSTALYTRGSFVSAVVDGTMHLLRTSGTADTQDTLLWRQTRDLSIAMNCVHAGKSRNLKHRAVDVLRATLPALTSSVNARCLSVVPGMLLTPATIQLLRSQRYEQDALLENVERAMQLSDTLERVCRADRIEHKMVPFKSNLLQNVTDICVLSDHVFGNPDRALLCVQHGEEGLQDQTIFMPSKLTATDPDFCSSAPSMCASDLRRASSVRNALGIAPDAVLQWGHTSLQNVCCEGTYLSVPDGRPVQSSIYKLFNVKWTQAGVPHNAMLQVPNANTTSSQNECISRLKSVGSVTTYDASWNIRVLFIL